MFDITYKGVIQYMSKAVCAANKGDNMTGKKKFEYDLIRCVAICCVVLYHFNYELIARDASSPLMTYYLIGTVGLGGIGVSLFLIMSGALSYVSFGRCIEASEGNKKKAVAGYYKKRFLALFPMFWVTIGLACMFYFVPAGLRPGKDFLITLSGMGGYLSFSGIKSPFAFVGEWYQGMIMILYAIFPLLYLCVKKKPAVTLAVMTVYVTLMIIFYPFERDKTADFLIRIYDLMLGIYVLLYLPRSKYVMPAALVIFVLAAFVNLPIRDRTGYAFVQGVSFYVFLLELGQLIGGLNGKIAGAFRAIVSIIAKYSYAIFLVQHLILVWALTPFTGLELGVVKYLCILVYICALMFFTAFAVKATADGFVNVFKKKE